VSYKTFRKKRAFCFPLILLWKRFLLVPLLSLVFGEAAVRELLKGFNRVEVWTGNLETSRIWVLSGEESRPDNRNADISLSRETPTQQPKQRTQKKPHFRVATASAQATNASVRIEDLPPNSIF
jgi:hypothetical protein